MKRPRPPLDRLIAYAVPPAITGACLVLAVYAHGTDVGRILLYATAAAAPFMWWAAGRYATFLLITAAWLGRSASALWSIDGYDDRTNLVVALLWPCLWVIAVAGIASLQRIRTEDRALGI